MVKDVKFYLKKSIYRGNGIEMPLPLINGIKYKSGTENSMLLISYDPTSGTNFKILHFPIYLSDLHKLCELGIVTYCHPVRCMLKQRYFDFFDRKNKRLKTRSK